jgi:hypothetical protein
VPASLTVRIPGSCSFRITGVVTPDAAGTVDRLVVDGWSEALRARYGCPVIPEVTLKRCRHLEATMGPRLDYLARQPLPSAGTRRLVWRDGQLTEVSIAPR